MKQPLKLFTGISVRKSEGNFLKMKKVFLALFVIVIGGFMYSCSDDDNGTAKLSLRLTDSPAEFEEVLIDVQEVRVSFQSEDDENVSWITLDGLKPAVIDLLTLTNGTDILLAEEELPVGTISQIRLVLGDNNQVKVDGEYYDIKTPSAQQSGLKLNVHAELQAGLTYKMWLDFDAGRSIVEKGNGSYSLKPVIRTFTEATSGAIKGIVSPVESNVYIHAISEDLDTISTYADSETGYFLIRALDEGEYKLKFLPVDGFQEKEIEDVPVTIGNVTDVGDVEIEAEIIE